MSRDRVVIKGTSNGVIITVGSGDWQTILAQLAHKLSRKASFFKGGRVALAVGKRLLDPAEIEVVGNLLSEQNMTLWAVDSDAPETRAAAGSLGLESRPVADPPKSDNGGSRPDTPAPATRFIERTLRSGQSVTHPGNVVVVGDVNPGAKVTAGGHVIVWGRLRGTVQAGAAIGEAAFVCALQLAPMQLIIGNIISRSPGDDAAGETMPEMAIIQNGRIVAEPWR